VSPDALFVIWRFGVATTALYLVALAIMASRPLRSSGHPTRALRYVMMVPALNEELVLDATLRCLCELAPARTTVLVIDDGSDDDTAKIAEAFADRGVHLVHRAAPNARQGKGAALNAGYQHLSGLDLGDRADVVIGVVDADGRLGPGTLEHIDAALADPSIGGVQAAVRIANRHTLLARFQDFEFVGFSYLFQAARHRLGSVGLGGNGQFTRLDALATLGPQPWTDCLAEDLDLGLRLTIAGWRLGFVRDATVDQQGVLTVAALVRQRTRWVHGHLQCWARIPALLRSGLPWRTVADTLVYLTSPGILACLSLGIAATTALGATGLLGSPLSSSLDPADLAVVWLPVGVPLVVLAVTYHRRASATSWAKAAALAIGLIIYNLVWYLAAWQALAAIATRRQSWAKTSRIPEPTRVPTFVIEVRAESPTAAMAAACSASADPAEAA
jgi:1,2-diacylglycerol 3-beta-glucosyltransferase